MIEYQYFSENELQLLNACILKNCSGINVYYLTYSQDFRVCGFIEILFESTDKIILTTGSYADDIRVLSPQEFLSQKQRYDDEEGVSVSMKKLLDQIEWKNVRDSILLDIKCTNQFDNEYYTTIIFEFDKRNFVVSALIDELAFR